MLSCEEDDSLSESTKKYYLSKMYWDGKLFYEFLYDDDYYINRVNKYYYDSDGEFMYLSYSNYEYNENKILSKIKHYIDPENLFINYDSLVYNENNLVERMLTIRRGSNLSQYYTFVYNADNQIIRRLTYDSDNVETRDIRFEYDSKENYLKETISWYTEMMGYDYNIYEYEYDNRNNPFYNIHFNDYVVYPISRNNAIKKKTIHQFGMDEETIAFEYNSRGYPTKQITPYQTYEYEYIVIEWKCKKNMTLDSL